MSAYTYTLNVRGVPQALRKQFAKRAVDEGTTVKVLVIRALTAFIKRETDKDG